MDSDNTTELSMSDILASIRKILYKSIGGEKQPAPLHNEPFVPQNENNYAPNMEQDVATVCENIRKMVDYQPEKVAAKPELQDQTYLTPKSHVTVAEKPEYDEIVEQFSELFAHRNHDNPCVDNSLRVAAEAAVVNEIVPVLKQWLQFYLPDLVAEEIKRVMVKTDKY